MSVFKVINHYKKELEYHFKNLSITYKINSVEQKIFNRHRRVGRLGGGGVQCVLRKRRSEGGEILHVGRMQQEGEQSCHVFETSLPEKIVQLLWLKKKRSRKYFIKCNFLIKLKI